VEIGKCEALTELTLRFNKLTIIPQEAASWGKLKYLDLRDNQLEGLPRDAVAGWVALEKLFLSTNVIIGLPPTLRTCTNLKQLELRENKLDECPVEIGALENLEILNISKNNLTSFPGEVAAGLVNLRELFLANNKIAPTLPPEMGVMTKLRILSLSNNKLSSLPEEMGSMSELEEVFIVKNVMTSMPESIGGWKSCTTINLTENKGLKKLPEGISSLVNLAFLFLDKTKVALERHVQLLYVQTDVRGGKVVKKKKKK